MAGEPPPQIEKCFNFFSIFLDYLPKRFLITTTIINLLSSKVFGKDTSIGKAIGVRTIEKVVSILLFVVTVSCNGDHLKMSSGCQSRIVSTRIPKKTKEVDKNITKFQNIQSDQSKENYWNYVGDPDSPAFKALVFYSDNDLV